MPPVLLGVAAAAAGYAASSGAIAAGIATAGSIAATIIGSVTSGAVSFLGNAVFGLNRRKQPQILTSAIVGVTQPVSARRVIYGQQRVGGVCTFVGTSGGATDLHVVLTLAGHPVEKIGAVYIGGVMVLDENGNGANTYGGYIVSEKNLGGADQAAFPELVSRDIGWTDACTQAGCAGIHLWMEWDVDHFSNFSLTDVTVDVLGKNDIYDPRTGTTGFSNNAALCVADYLTNPDYGLAASWDSEINTADLEAAANLCDEYVAVTPTISPFTASAGNLITIEEPMQPSGSAASPGMWAPLLGDQVTVQAGPSIALSLNPTVAAFGDTFTFTAGSVSAQVSLTGGYSAVVAPGLTISVGMTVSDSQGVIPPGTVVGGYDGTTVTLSQAPSADAEIDLVTFAGTSAPIVITGTVYGSSLATSPNGGAAIIYGPSSVAGITAGMNVTDSAGALQPGTTVTAIDAGGTLPAGLSADTTYYWIPAGSQVAAPTGTGVPLNYASFDGHLAASLADAFAGTAIDFTNAGSGALTLTRIGERRYCCDGVFTVDQTPEQILSSVLSAMGGSAGRAIWTGGEWSIQAAAYKTPTVSLSEADLRADNFSVSVQASRRDYCNGMRGTFVNPANNWQPDDYPPVQPAAYLTADGGVPAWNQLDLPFTLSSSGAQRIATIELERNRLELQIPKLPCKLSALQLAAGDTVMFSYARYGWVDQIFEVQALGFVLDTDKSGAPILGVDLGVRAIAADAYSWEQGQAVPVVVGPQTQLPSPSVAGAPGAPTVTEQYYQTTNAAGVQLEAILSAALSTDGYVTVYQFEYTPTGSGDWTVLPQVAAPEGSETVEAQIYGITPGAYDFRVKAGNDLGAWSDYATSTDVAIVAMPAPAAVTGFAVSQNENGTLSFTWDALADYALAGYTLAYGAVGGSLETATVITQGALTTQVTDVSVGVGSWVFYLYAVDVAGQDGPCVSVTFNVEAASLPAAQITGQVGPDQISSVDTSQVTGTLPAGQVGDGLTSAQIDSVDAAAIEGLIEAAQIDTLEATQLTGELAADQIASLAMSQLTGLLEGDQLALDTVQPGSLTLAQRGVTVQGISFQANAADNTVSWSSGYICYIDSSGNETFAAISAGSVSAGDASYIYWTEGATTLSGTNSNGVAVGPNVVCVATYLGGADLVVGYGATIVDGSRITESTVPGAALVPSAITPDLVSSIDASQVAGTLAPDQVGSGLTAAQIASVDAAAIEGLIEAAQIDTLEAAQLTGELAADQIASIDAGQVSGTLPAGQVGSGLTSAQIASVDAAAIEGLIEAAQIDTLEAAQLTGALAADQIASIDAGQVSGTLPAGQVGDGLTSAQIASVDAAAIEGLIEAAQVASLAMAQLTGLLEGDQLALDTVQPGSLTLAQRGVTVQGISFQANAADSTVSWSSGYICYIDSSGNETFAAISAGSVSAGDASYIYWTEGATTLSGTNSNGVAVGPNVVCVATYLGGADLVVGYGATIVDGSRITESTVPGAALVPSAITPDLVSSIDASQVAGTLAPDQVGSGLTAAQIASVDAAAIEGLIEAAQIDTLEAAQLTGELAADQIASIDAGQVSGTLPAGQVGSGLTSAQIASVDAAAIEGLIEAAQIDTLEAAQLTGALAADQIASIDAGQVSGTLPAGQVGDGLTSAQIASVDAAAIEGLIEAAQVASLAMAQLTGLLEGDQLALDTVQPGSLTLAQRGVTVQGISFQANAADSTVSWSSGYICYVDSSGNETFAAISAGSVSVDDASYICWTEGATTLSGTTSNAVAVKPNVVCVATYLGGADLVVGYGATIVDGSRITESTVPGAALVPSAITPDLVSSIDASQVAGTLAADQVGSGLTAAQIASVDAAAIEGLIEAAQITSLAAEQLTGQLDGSQIGTSAVDTSNVVPNAITDGATAFTASYVSPGTGDTMQSVTYTSAGNPIEVTCAVTFEYTGYSGIPRFAIARDGTALVDGLRFYVSSADNFSFGYSIDDNGAGAGAHIWSLQSESECTWLNISLSVKEYKR